MKQKFRVFSVFALSMISQSVFSVPFTFDGRTLGMGGTSVATADLATAAWSNPAMLTNQRPADDFSLLIGAGAFLRDNDDLETDIENFQDADDRRQAAVNAGDPVGEAAAIQEMSKIVSGLDGKVFAPEVTGMAAIGMAFDSFAMAVSLRSDIIAGGAVTDLSSDPGQVTDPSYNILNVEGVSATEIGLSFAKDIRLLNRNVSVGIKPKVVDLEVFTLREPILSASAGLDNINDEDKKFHLGTFTTVDLGLAANISRSVMLGLNIRNLVTDSFDVNGQTLNYDTEARIGVAYRNRFLMLAADYDLTENKPLLANSSFGGLKTQYLAVGAEFNAFDFAQLRIGASRNTADGITGGAKDTAITAGIGFWLGFNLDVALTMTDGSLGGAMQAGFRF